MEEKIFSKLEVSNKELELFNKLKNNYNISQGLFIKDNKKYSIKIYVDDKSLNYLLGNIEKENLFYTLKQGNKIIYKDKTKKQIISLITKILDKEI